MKRTLILLLSLFVAHGVRAQRGDSVGTVPKFRIAASYGADAMNPDQINDRIAETNGALGSSTNSIKSMPEFSGTLTIRPNQDTKIVVLRAGYSWTERDYAFSVPETEGSSTPIGKVRGSITEKYSVYPFSIGAGLSTLSSDFQIELDFIYALGYISENGSFTATTGTTTYSNTLFSPAYGFRIAAQTSVPLTPSVSLQLEVAYRGLKFEDFENQGNAQPSNIEFSVSGVTGSIGLAFTP
ncbi:MAG TPA: hypothetical protein VMF88_12175 [Bacteroidota bacterium]|nr:hypothetical protein [Bacteroidota bacterium]